MSFSVEDSLTSPFTEVESTNMDKDENEKDVERNEDNEKINLDESNDPHKHAYQRKPRKRTSKIWNEIIEVTTSDGSKKGKCSYCGHLLAVPSSGATTQFHRHLQSCTQRQLATKKQKVLSLERHGSEEVSSLTNFKYDHSKVRELASHMVLYHEYPFIQMEHVLFNKFMRAVTPHWQKISRTTAKNDCISTYEIEKIKLKTLLKDVNRISITTDMWTSGNQKVSYMVVTGHFIDSDWKLQKRVLNFCNVPPPHSGVIVADALHKCFVEWGIENKIQSITVDNAKYNDTCLRILKDNFALKKNLLIKGRHFHVRCCAHIVNLLVQDGLTQIRDIIDNVREGVKYICASEPRMTLFAEISKQLQLPSKKLILDCPTRWNGTYMMLAASLEFKEVFPRYQDRDPTFSYVPSSEDWVKVEHVCHFLGVFNEVTKIISGSDYPTANLFLTEVWRIHEVLNEKSLDDNDFIRAMALVMKKKFDKYWGECNTLMAIAAVLDPRYKMMLVEFAYPEIYSGMEASTNIAKVRETLYELYNEYVQINVAAQNAHVGEGNARVVGSSSSGSIYGIGKNIVTGKAKFESFIRKVDTIQPVKSELDVYLEESVYICDENSSSHFDALEWWKANNLKFRVLSKMAADILSIPITTVASESTFSAGGRVIDPHRASLSTETVQVLLCGADWVRVLHGLKKKSEREEPDYSEVLLP